MPVLPLLVWLHVCTPFSNADVCLTFISVATLLCDVYRRMVCYLCFNSLVLPFLYAGGTVFRYCFVYRCIVMALIGCVVRRTVCGGATCCVVVPVCAGLLAHH